MLGLALEHIAERGRRCLCDHSKTTAPEFKDREPGRSEVDAAGRRPDPMLVNGPLRPSSSGLVHSRRPAARRQDSQGALSVWGWSFANLVCLVGFFLCGLLPTSFFLSLACFSALKGVISTSLQQTERDFEAFEGRTPSLQGQLTGNLSSPTLSILPTSARPEAAIAGQTAPDACSLAPDSGVVLSETLFVGACACVRTIVEGAPPIPSSQPQGDGRS